MAYRQRQDRHERTYFRCINIWDALEWRNRTISQKSGGAGAEIHTVHSSHLVVGALVVDFNDMPTRLVLPSIDKSAIGYDAAVSMGMESAVTLVNLNDNQTT